MPSQHLDEKEQQQLRALVEYFRKLGLDYAGRLGIVLPPTPIRGGKALESWEGLPVFYAPVDTPSVVVIPPDPDDLLETDQFLRFCQ